MCSSHIHLSLVNGILWSCGELGIMTSRQCIKKSTSFIGESNRQGEKLYVLHEPLTLKHCLITSLKLKRKKGMRGVKGEIEGGRRRKRGRVEEWNGDVHGLMISISPIYNFEVYIISSNLNIIVMKIIQIYINSVDNNESIYHFI